MASLTLSRANKLIRGSFAKAASLNLKPLAVIIYDAGGNIKAFQSQDGASIGRFQIAGGKARGALATGTGSRWMNGQAADRPHFIAGLSSVVEGGVVPVPGAVVARNQKGEIVAVVGISGDTSDNDEACAISAIEECGLIADAG